MKAFATKLDGRDRKEEIIRDNRGEVSSGFALVIDYKLKCISNR